MATTNEIMLELTNVHGPQDVFGAMVKIAASIIKYFHSDLYYDATHLESIWTDKEFTFWWSVGSCGTDMAIDTSGCSVIGQIKYGGQHNYEVTVGADEHHERRRTVTFRRANRA